VLVLRKRGEQESLLKYNEEKEEIDESEVRHTDKQDVKKFISIVVAVSIIFVLFIFLISPKEKEEEVDESLVTIKEIGEGFLYYDGDVYYKQKLTAIKDESYVGEEIGINAYDLKYDNISDNSFSCDKDKIYIYATDADTPVYAMKGNENILLVPNKSNYNGYYLYFKDETVSESTKRNFSNYLKENPDAECEVVSYKKTDIPLGFQLKSFSKAETAYANSSYISGYMAYYILVDAGDYYSMFKGNGNMFSNVILLTSEENGIDVQYVYENEGLSSVLIELFSDYFGYDKEEIDEFLDKTSEEAVEVEVEEETSETVEEEEHETYYEDGDISQDKLIMFETSNSSEETQTEENTETENISEK
jgi:hypothetical protein